MTIIIKLPPNKTGDLDGTIYSRLNEFKNAIAETFDTNLVTGASASASSVYENALQYSPTKVIDGDDETYWTTEKGTNTGVIEIQFDEAKQFDVVSIEEYITKGQRISEFNVEYQRENGEWAVFGDGKTIGAKNY
ncbi:discoidin domain-containing protein [Coprobacillaceae bacterium CR2/5/TPMF4]|nr:discoidin domain-containing protein [Coprobacillaceae bacterium CR2/5/TPMF4]